MDEAWLTSLLLIPAVVGAAALLLGAVAYVLLTPVYKHVVCLRYLFGGWKAVVPLVSALPAALGVFLLILVFAIMDGFVRETREMTRGTLADVIVDGHLGGIAYYDEFARRIEALAGVEAATPIVQTYAVARIKPRYLSVRPLVRPCLLLGIRPAEKAEMGRFHEYLQERRHVPSAEVLGVPAGIGGAGPPRLGCIAGLGLVGAPSMDYTVETVDRSAGPRVLAGVLAAVSAVAALGLASAARRRRGVGWRVAAGLAGLASLALAATAVLMPPRPTEIERTQVTDRSLLAYGSDLVISTIPIRATGALDVEAGGVPRVSTRAFVLVDTFKSGYWEADSSHLYVDFEVAQRMAGMDARPAEGDGPGSPARASQIHVKVRHLAHSRDVVAAIEAAWADFVRERPEADLVMLEVNTWETQQRMILTVVEIERNITALMLGLMFVGFGVLIALISYVMAYIKSRDVGILKALGARDAGVGSLFLGYGFIIGLIGTTLGLVGALVMLHYLDPIEIWVNQTLGVDVFPREMYYFEHIPRHISPLWCAAVAGAVLVLATLASMAGGLLAALKQPVETLRYE